MKFLKKNSTGIYPRYVRRQTRSQGIYLLAAVVNSDIKMGP